jgi:hypothetical protein
MRRHHGKPARSATDLDEKITLLDGMTLQFGKICVTVHLKIGSWFVVSCFWFEQN